MVFRKRKQSSPHPCTLVPVTCVERHSIFACHVSRASTQVFRVWGCLLPSNVSPSSTCRLLRRQQVSSASVFHSWFFSGCFTTPLTRRKRVAQVLQLVSPANPSAPPPDAQGFSSSPSFHCLVSYFTLPSAVAAPRVNYPTCPLV